MSKNLFDFGNENIEDLSNSQTNLKNKTNATYNQNNNDENLNNLQGEAKNLYEKYKDYSQSDLVNEFLSSSKQKLKEGSLTQEKISSTANALLPFLNNEQKEMMSRLLEKLND